jgi:enoyl-CoA hydratase
MATPSSLGTILPSLTHNAKGTILTLTISRPSKLNSLNTHLISLLPTTLHKHTTNPHLLAVILTGAGSKSFIGGADIAEMSSLQTPKEARSFITSIHEACDAIRKCPVPVIARVNGFALGAGLEIAAACDVRVASRNAKFGMPEVRVGVPSVVEAALLPGLIGWGRTRRLLLFGETIGAEEALQWGLVEKVVEGEKALDEAVEEWVGCLVDSGREAVRGQKELMRVWEEVGVREGIKAGIGAFGRAFEKDEKRESEPGRIMGAFLRRQEGRKKEKEEGKARL